MGAWGRHGVDRIGPAPGSGPITWARWMFQEVIQRQVPTEAGQDPIQ